MIALLGNLARDLRPAPPHPGGGPFHGARPFRHMEMRARVYARCAAADREQLFEPLTRMDVDATYVPGESTACFDFTYDGDRREMSVVAAGDVWLPDELPPLPADVSWVHVAPLLRSDFPTESLAALAAGRRLLLDGQGLVRAPRLGPLVLDADFDPEALRYVTALKLAEEEAEVLGDPAALPVPEVLVTHGSAGATVYAGGRVDDVWAEAIDVEPTGSGDAFASSYAAARAAGHEPVAAAQRAANLVSQLLAALRER